MFGLLEGELWFHRWHMWPVRSSSVPAISSSFVFIDSNSFSKDGRKINVGDCALFTPSHESLPFVGRIRKLIVGKENSLSLSVNWLYRPADVKLKEGALLEAAPNEIFYSFHKDEITVASLLHPCKVTFLRKGVELPSGISSFVCRQVYDIEGECLWWLTDKDYINSYLTQERQEEVNQLLDKTRIEMYGAVQTGGRSPKAVNGPNGSAQLKHSSDNVQNSSSSISSHAKSRKREHDVHNSDSVKRERLSKVDDADSGQLQPDHIIKTEIAKVTDEKGGLIDFGGVEKLTQLMRPDSSEKKLDLASRTMLVDVISVTEQFECLGRFVQIRGLSVLDEWLQEIHKGKICDGSLKGNDKSVEEFLFSLLRALDKLPVNLHALQTCNVGKSVNHLRSHKNSEIQKKARSLVSTWKRRVEAEMNIIETKSSTSRGGSWPNKSMISEVSHMGSKRIGSSYEVGPKSSTSPPSPLKALQPKHSSGDAVTKSPTSPVSAKLSPSSATKEVRSCSSSQSPNNSQSCSSNHGKQDQKLSGKIDSLQINNVPDTIVDLSRVKDGLAGRDEEHGSSSGVTPKPGKLYEASYSSINALVESCAKFSEASVSPSVCDDVGINLLASVATGEMSRSDMSPACSHGNNSPLPEDSCSVNVAKLRLIAQDESLANGHSADSSTKGGSNQQVPPVGTHISGDSKDASFGCEVRIGVDNVQSDSPVVMTPDVKPTSLIEDTNGCKEGVNKPTKNTEVLPNAVATSTKIETQINEESASWSSSDMHEDEEKLAHKRSSSGNLATTSCGDVDIGPTSKDANDKKAEIHDEQSERQNMDSGTSVSQHSSERAQENNENDDKVPSVTIQEVRPCEKPTDVAETICVAEMTVKLDFDLNEDVPSDDGIQGEIEKSCHPNNPSLLPFSGSPVNGNQPALITVASAAKGPFYPSENLLRGKAELGWKGSAATSAFRPAEPRKVDIPAPDNRTSEKARPLLDFDLNVGVIEDAIQHNAPSCSGGGLDLDLNACEEIPEVVQLSVSSSIRHPRSIPSGGPSLSRGFDLNGPGVEEVGGESVSFSKNNMQFMSGVPNVKMNNIDIGNYSTWFPPNNTFPAITIPSHRMLNSVTPSTSLKSEMFRGPVLSSSPAVAFPSTVPFQYSAFPFETNFSLPSVSNTFSSVSNPYVDSSSGGIPFFPNIPSVGPNSVVSMPYRPYFMSLPGGSSNVGPDGRKWLGSQGLDLNAGPGGGGTDDKLPSALRQIPSQDEQLKMFQQMAAAAGSGTSSKRKEPDGMWDGDRITYKHPTRQ